MKDLTIILPIHKFSDEMQQLLTTALESFKYDGEDKDGTLLICGPKSEVDRYQIKNKETVTFVETEEGESTKFSHLINKAALACNTKYFTILEIDDKFTDCWFRNAEFYMSNGHDDALVLPLTEVVDYEHKEVGSIGYINEAVWASSFSEEIGYLDQECIQEFFNFNTTGGIFNKETFIKVGMLKESMELSFWYEFVLRLLNSGNRIYTVPKVGYVHLVKRPESVSENYNTTMSPEEAEWWFETAKKEYLFTKDREKTYE